MNQQPTDDTMPVDDDWPPPEPGDDDWPISGPGGWPEPQQPEPGDDDWPISGPGGWPEPQPAEPESTDILDQPAGTPGPLPCGCDAAMVIATGQHLRGNHE